MPVLSVVVEDRMGPVDDLCWQCFGFLSVF